MTFNKKSPVFRAVLVILEHNNAPMVVGAVFSAYFTLYLSAFIYKMGWLLYLAIFDQGFLAFFIIPTLYKIIHTGHLVFIFFSCLFSPQSLCLSAFFSLFIFLYFRHYVLLYIYFHFKNLNLLKTILSCILLKNTSI